MKRFLFISFILILFSACSSDDTLPEPPEVIVNEFFYGVDGSESIEVLSGFYKGPQVLEDGVIKTDVIITGTGFSIADTDELEGEGFLIDIDLYGDINEALQTGRYRVDINEDIGNCRITFLESFDTGQAFNLGVSLESGIVIVEPYRNGYLIRIDAIDAEGNEFYGNYLGVPQLIL